MSVRILASRSFKRLRAAALLSIALALAGCAGYGGDAYDYGYPTEGYPDVGFGYDLDYFEPFGYDGYDYDGWGAGYSVGPWVGGYSRGGVGGRPLYHPAAPVRPMPSIPMLPRGGGMGRVGH